MKKRWTTRCHLPLQPVLGNTELTTSCKPRENQGSAVASKTENSEERFGKAGSSLCFFLLCLMNPAQRQCVCHHVPTLALDLKTLSNCSQLAFLLNHLPLLFAELLGRNCHRAAVLRARAAGVWRSFEQKSVFPHPSGPHASV